MAIPELSRKAARIFNKYKVPLDIGFDWAIEIEAAKSEEDLSLELQAFLKHPYFIKRRPKPIKQLLLNVGVAACNSTSDSEKIELDDETNQRYLMYKTLPIQAALEVCKDNAELTATINDMALDGNDFVSIQYDEAEQILGISKESPSSTDSHVDSTNWAKKPRIATFSSISKAIDEEERYTFSPWYVPDSLDAHGEWTDRKEVQQAFWKYLSKDNRDIRLQHNTDIVAGEWVEGATWPFEVTVPIKHVEGDTEYTFPAGTPFLGIIWEPWAWELIKKGEIRGLSIGGTAIRADETVLASADNPTGDVAFSKSLGFILPEDFLTATTMSKQVGFITEPTREGLAAELSELLADAVTFRFIAQGFHWNVSGINFQQFHDFFQELYEDAESSIDPIAENIRKLNYDAPFRISDFMCGIAQMEIPETNDPMVMSQILYIANEQVRVCIVKAFALADAIDEQGIANFLAERLDMHSKWQWQLRAIVGDAVADAYEVDISHFGNMLNHNFEAHLNQASPERVEITTDEAIQ